MYRKFALLVAAFALVAGRASALDFRVETIYSDLGVGYAVRLLDMNQNGKLDILVVDKTRVIWFENPDWTMHVISEGQTMPDNVCVAAHDIDGDGKLDLVIGADWQFTNENVGTIQWLHSGDVDANGNWKLYPIGSEPFVHRMQWADIDGDGAKELIVLPLLAKGSTNEERQQNPIRVLAYKIPSDPFRGRWVPETLNHELHVSHNFAVKERETGSPDLLVASFEGVSRLRRQEDGRWNRTRIGAGDQSNPQGSRGSSEVAYGAVGDTKVIATIEPWHGDKVVAYTPPETEGELWRRHVLDDELKWGHAVAFANLDGGPSDEIVVGVRDNLDPERGLLRGLRIYQAEDLSGEKWRRIMVDRKGEAAIEDLAVGDLNGNGAPDIVAVGRQTHNVRIYWNKSARKE